MNTCKNCGTKLPEQARFCGNCGTDQNDIATSYAQTQLSDPELLASIPPKQPLSSSDIPATPHGQYLQVGQAPDLQTEKQHPWESVPLTPLATLATNTIYPTPQLPDIPGTPQVNQTPGAQGTPSPANSPSQPVQPLSNYPPQSAPGAVANHATPHTPSEAEPHPGALLAWSDHTRQTGHMALVGPVTGTKAVRGFAAKWVVIILMIVVIVVGGSGALLYGLTRPQPIISLLSSPYRLGNTPAGSSGTTLHISGQHFSNNSAITFLLDNHPAPGAPIISSDANGNVNASLPVTSAWPIGKHTLTGKDASNDSSGTGITLQIVPQGQAGTPGPFGAPPDDAGFNTTITIQGEYAENTGPMNETEKLIVTGRPGPKGGTVCKSIDNGQPQQYTGATLENVPMTQNITTSCTGTYKGGIITYTEKILSYVAILNNDSTQITCQLTQPGPYEQLSGSYTAQGMFSGTLHYISFPGSDFSCTPTFQFSLLGGSGNWTGSMSRP